MRYLRRFLIGYLVLGIMLVLFVLMYLMYQPRETEVEDVQNISDNTPSDTPFISYIAQDDAGILQVWRYSEGESMRLTDSATPVTQYDVQGNIIVYVSDATLWVNTLNDDTAASALTALSLPEYGGDFAYAFPQISLDETTIIYANNGLYRIPVNGGTPQQLLEDVSLGQGEGANEPGDVRVYQESQFINSDTLLLHVGIWESRLPAIYDLSTGDYRESEPYTYPVAYPLADGRLLYYGNSFRGMLSGLYAASTDNLLDVHPVIGGDYGGLLSVESTIVLAITEITPGQVRALVTWLPDDPSSASGAVIVDVDLTTGTATIAQDLTSNANLQQITQLEFTPDGTAFIGLLNGEYRTDIYSGGASVGELARYDFVSDNLQILVDDDIMFFEQHTLNN